MFSNTVYDISEYVPITLEEIESFESEMNIQLPSYFKEFLLLFSGTIPNNSIWENGLAVGRFCAIDHELSYRSIKKGLMAQRRQNFFPDIYLPFGIDISGQVLYLKIKEPNSGEVVYEPMDGTFTDDPFEKLSNNFVDFINGLQSWEPPPGE